MKQHSFYNLIIKCSHGQGLWIKASKGCAEWLKDFAPNWNKPLTSTLLWKTASTSITRSSANIIHPHTRYQSKWPWRGISWWSFAAVAILRLHTCQLSAQTHTFHQPFTHPLTTHVQKAVCTYVPIWKDKHKSAFLLSPWDLSYKYIHCKEYHT